MNYLSNKYNHWYDQIISNALNRSQPSGYTEIHHIVPKCLGGTNNESNLVILTAREHFICHLLLTKFTIGQQRHKMLHAMMIMKGFQSRDRYINSRLFEACRLEYSLIRSTAMIGSRNHRYGTKMSDETKKKISEAKKGKSMAGKYQPKASNETKKKMKEIRSNGNMKWWNNGVENKRQKESPGSEWKPGRLFTKELYNKFCKSTS